jgi:DNA-binding transcriptional regulator LsrR (DeoR family)
MSDSERHGDIKKKIAGEILYQWFDSEGQQLPKLIDKIASLSLDQLREYFVSRGKTVMLLAAGSHLAGPVMAAYRGKLFNMLICDDILAKELCRLSAEAKKSKTTKQQNQK